MRPALPAGLPPELLEGSWAVFPVQPLMSLAGLVTLVRASMAGQPAALETAEIVVPEGGFDPALRLAGEMFTRYSLPFEAASVLLLASAVGVLVIAKRQRPGTREGSTP